MRGARLLATIDPIDEGGSHVAPEAGVVPRLAGEAMQAPPEEFLYLACLHEGTGVEKPDFLAVVDAQRGEVVHETADAEHR